jgi:hypothetical protein
MRDLYFPTLVALLALIAFYILLRLLFLGAHFFGSRESGRRALTALRQAHLSERASRVLLSIEVIICCGPIALLFLGMAFSGIAMTFSTDLGNNFDVPAERNYILGTYGLFIFATLVCFCRLLLAFILAGADRLRKISIFWWLLPLLCSALVVASIFVVFGFSFDAAVGPSDALSYFAMFGFGLPFLVPLLHLILERWFWWRTAFASAVQAEGSADSLAE